MSDQPEGSALLVVVAYDVVSDRRRNRLHRKLKGFGEPVQYSVFECVLDAEGLRRVQTMVRREISPRTDTVRYYVLCRACRRRVRAVNGVTTSVQETVVV